MARILQAVFALWMFASSCALPWSEDTGQEKKNVQKDEPTDKTEQESSAAAKTPSAVTITKDDITAVIVAKIKKKRDNNEKIGRLLKTYGVAQLTPHVLL